MQLQTGALAGRQTGAAAQDVQALCPLSVSQSLQVRRAFCMGH